MTISESSPIPSWGDNFVPVIPVDHAVHTGDAPFCMNDACPCHEDVDNINMINDAYQDGILTADEASEIVKGVRSW